MCPPVEAQDVRHRSVGHLLDAVGRRVRDGDARRGCGLEVDRFVAHADSHHRAQPVKARERRLTQRTRHSPHQGRLGLREHGGGDRIPRLARHVKQIRHVGKLRLFEFNVRARKDRHDGATRRDGREGPSNRRAPNEARLVAHGRDHRHVARRDGVGPQKKPARVLIRQLPLNTSIVASVVTVVPGTHLVPDACRAARVRGVLA